MLVRVFDDPVCVGIWTQIGLRRGLEESSGRIKRGPDELLEEFPGNSLPVPRLIRTGRVHETDAKNSTQIRC